MVEIRAAKIVADPLSQLSSRKQAVVFDNMAFAMNPFRLNGVKPGALCGQEERQDTHPFARLLGLLIVLTNEGAHQLGNMPGGVIPDQEPVAFAMYQQAFAAPVEELGRNGTHRASIHKTQPHLLSERKGRIAPMPKHSIAGQRFGIRIVLPPLLLDQTQRVFSILPSVSLGQRKTRPPDLIQVTNSPIWARAAIGD